MTDSDLKARLEAAEEGSRELSDEVLKALGWSLAKRRDTEWNAEWRRPDGSTKIRGGRDPSPTTNLQDAVDLVPEGFRVSGMHECSSGDWYAELDRRKGPADIVAAAAATPALALCAAILRARQAEKE